MWNSRFRCSRFHVNRRSINAPIDQKPETKNWLPLVLCLLLVFSFSPVTPGQQIDLKNDAAFRKYNQQRLQQQGANNTQNQAMTGLLDPTGQLRAPGGAQRISSARSQNEHPVLAVVDLYSRTLNSRTINVLSQTIWDQVYSTERYAMLSRKSVLKALTRQKQNMNPSDPYSAPVRPKQVATALNCDYLLFGNIGRLGETYSLALYVYSAKSERVEAAKTVIGLEIKDLLVELPGTVRQLLQRLDKPQMRPQVTELPLETELPVQTMDPPVQQGTKPPIQTTPPPTGGGTAAERNQFEEKIEKRLDTLEELIKQLNGEIKSLKELKNAVQQATPTPKATQTPPKVTPTVTPEPTKPPEDTISAQDRAQAAQNIRTARPLPYESPDRLRHLQRAVELAPDNWEYFRLYMHALCIQQHYETAIDKGDEGLTRFKDDSFILTMTGYAKYMTEQYRGARTDLEKAVKYDQKSLQAHYYLGLALAKLDANAARVQLAKFIQMAANEPAQAPFVREARAELSALDK